jgi:hypothetical protein
MNNKFFTRIFTILAFLQIVGMLFYVGPSLITPLETSEEVSVLAAEISGTPSYLPIVRNGSPLPSVFGTESRSIDGKGGLYKMIGAGVYWWRRNGVLWSQVEATKGSYDWDALEDLEVELANAAQNGIQVILIVRGTPDWAQAIPEIPCGPIKESELGAFADFMKALVSRYSLPPYSVKQWEIWNEPDVDHTLLKNPESKPFGCWGDNTDSYYGGGYYADMLKEVYPAVKEADPDSQVLVGGLLLDCDPNNPPSGKDCTPAKFLEGILINGGGDYFDGVSYHAYDYYGLDGICPAGLGVYCSPNWGSAWNESGPVSLAKHSYLTELLDQYNIKDKFLLNSESALLTDQTCDQDCQTTKAHYLAQAFASAISLDLKANIWFSVFGWRNSELLELDGTPLPAYDAFKFAQEELKDSEYVREVSDNNQIKIFEFDRGDRRIWLMWSMKSTPTLVDLPGMPDAVYDALGNPITPSDPLAINWKTYYLEWLP